VSDSISRCAWAGSDPLMVAYHDREWGVPLHHDRKLFEMLILEGAQAGLSWTTILRKRDNYRRAFSGFDPAAVARMDARAMRRLLTNEGIVRNRLKIESTVANARGVLRIQEEFGSFNRYIWEFVGGMPRQNHWSSLRELPAQTPESVAMSRDLKRRAFRFVGPTICYAFMQAVGMVNDHTLECFRRAELAAP
jgi:DNA-3-methyladenine glycosylase I